MATETSAVVPSRPQRPLRLAGGAHAVLLFHGLSSGPQELQFLARGLQRAGHTVHVPVIPGYSYHGTGHAMRPRAHWVAAALAEFDALRATHARVAVGGLCIGALLALRVAALRAPDVAQVLALSTTLHYDGWATPWSRRLLPLATWVPWAGRIGVREYPPYGVKDERLRTWIAAQMKDTGNSQAGAAVLRVRDLLEARRLMAEVRQGLASISAPLLLLHAQRDDVASLRSAFEVGHGSRSSRLAYAVFHDSYHMLSIDREKGAVLAKMIDFLTDPAAESEPVEPPRA